jgi:hypothetical protein
MAGTVAPNIVTDNLVLYLDAANTKSYPGSGTIWRNMTDGIITGTLTNGPTFNTGSGGNIVFDGVDDIVQLNTATDFNAPVNITMNIWTQFTNFGNSNSGHALFRTSNLSENTGFIMYQATTNPFNRIRTFVNTSSGLCILNGVQLLNTNQWYMVSVTYNASTLNIYINGSLDATRAGTGNIIYPSPVRTPRFGESFNSYFNGQISSFTLYNRALSATEITQNYNTTKGRYGL